MMPFSAFADGIVCPACGGTVTKQERRLVSAHDDFYKCDTCGKWAWVNKLGSLSLFSVGDQQILDAADASALINFSFNNGHLIPAKQVPTGIGRKDLPGYASDDGTPSVSSDGGIIWQPTWDDVFQKAIQFDTGDMAFWTYDFFTSDISHYYTNFDLTYKKGVSDAIITLSPSSKADFEWDTPISKLSFDSLNFTAPIKGKYFRLESPALYNSALDEIVYYSSSNPSSFYDSGVSLSGYVSKSSANRVYVRNCYWHIWLPKYKIIPYNSADKPTSQTNITINNNTWNGNIYTDNSTNLTYIYPQYTTINENNETVTNISNNPIIYNSETKQYYTYDTVTNNYYYITYEAPATPTPSPSPSPSPAPTETPSPSESPTPTPDPGTNPTSTPKPGDSGDISTPESGKPGGSSGGSGSSWWEKLLDKLGSALIDGLLGAISAVLKLIFKLLSTILGWIIWLVSQVLTLFPFLPPGLGALLIGGVVVCFVIGIIKFIRG